MRGKPRRLRRGGCHHLYRANRSQQFSEYYIKTPGGSPWPELSFQRDPNGRGVRLEVPNLGVQGRGTVTIEFLVEPDRPVDDADPFVLGLDAEFRLAETSPLGRNYRARVTDEVELLRGR